MASMALPPYTDSVFTNAIKAIKAPEKKPKLDLTGQTCLITGSNSGIGLACTKLLATFNPAHLILAVRTVAKGEAAAEPIRKAHPGLKISVWDLDMLSYASIQAFAARCNSLDRLDIAILNIGIGFATTCKLAPTGHEETIQVNYLSTALLSILLLPVLGRCEKPGRLSIVGSGTALFTPFANITANPLLPSFDLPYSGTSAGAERYGVSKLLVLMLVHTLSQHVSPDRVIINSPEPGLTADTSLHRDFSRSGKILMGLGKKMMGRRTEQAAYTYVDAVGSHGKESHGGFIVLWEICGMPAIMHTGEGKSAMERLWEETMVELEFADVKGILASIK